MSKCETCGAIYPDAWPQPIRCNHSHPGKDYRNPGDTKGTAIASQSPLAAGPKAWLALHAYRQDGPWNPAKAHAFYLQWLKTIPSYGCSCSSQWTAITKEHPPVFHSEREFIQWGFDRHNDVNKKLNKDLFPLDKAWEIRNG